MKFRFHSFTELAEILRAGGISVEDYAVKREAFISGLSENAVLEELDRRIMITRNSIVKGLGEPQHSRSGLTRGAAAAFSRAEKHLIQDALYRRAAAYALAINEVNACGGKIAAFPTAGSSGIVPGAIWAWWDTRHTSQAVPAIIEAPFPSQLRGAFLVSSLAGIIIAQRATLAGSEGGCQAECGSAGAMAASALGYLEALPLEDCFSAAALSLKNSLGLACDPVAGLVEVPCVKRNAFAAVNALLALDLTLAGIKSAVPFDEVVIAMKQIGDMMPAGIKETALGGLAITPAGLAIQEKVNAL